MKKTVLVLSLFSIFGWFIAGCATDGKEEVKVQTGETLKEAIPGESSEYEFEGETETEISEPEIQEQGTESEESEYNEGETEMEDESTYDESLE